MIKHSEIVAQIYERNKDTLTKGEINNVLVALFRMIKTHVLQGNAFKFINLFKIVTTTNTIVLKRSIAHDKHIRYNHLCKLRQQKKRLWTKTTAEDYWDKNVNK
jgi:hypothetical protein